MSKISYFEETKKRDLPVKAKVSLTFKIKCDKTDDISIM